MPTLHILERNRKKKGEKTQSRGDKMKEFRRVKKKIKSQMIIILIILFRILSLNFKTLLELFGATTLNHISKRLRSRKGPHGLLDEGTFSLYTSVYLRPGTSLSFVSELLFNPFCTFCGFRNTAAWVRTYDLSVMNPALNHSAVRTRHM